MSLYWRIEVISRRFRWFLSSPAEWCIFLWKKVEKRWMAAKRCRSMVHFTPLSIFFPLAIIDSVHHSAANAVSERNLKRHIVLFS